MKTKSKHEWWNMFRDLLNLDNTFPTLPKDCVRCHRLVMNKHDLSLLVHLAEDHHISYEVANLFIRTEIQKDQRAKTQNKELDWNTL